MFPRRRGSEMFSRRHQSLNYGAPAVQDAELRHLELQLEQQMQNMRSEAERRMQLLQSDLERQCWAPHTGRGAFTDTPAFPTGHDFTDTPAFPTNRDGHFELSLDVGDYSPEQLTVKTEGRKVTVTGKRDLKRRTPDGQVVEESQEWHQEAELPDDVDPDHVSCSLSHDGQLYLQAPRLALPDAPQRLVPVLPGPGARRSIISPFPRYR
ncbi:heat shock protein beta-9-like [Gastrophryne carolinensis]